MDDLKPELVIDGLMFPEGPRWWTGSLASDVYGLHVYKMEADGRGLVPVAKFEDWPCGLGELPDGTRIVVEMRSQKLWKLPRAHEDPELFADLAGIAVNEVNDLVTDKQGRSYSGCYGYDILGGADPKPGSVILTELDGTSRVVAGNVMFPNGMTISDDRADARRGPDTGWRGYGIRDRRRRVAFQPTGVRDPAKRQSRRYLPRRRGRDVDRVSLYV